MSSTDEETIDLFRKNYGKTQKSVPVEMKRNKDLAPLTDSSSDDSDMISVHETQQKYSDSDSSDSASDDKRHHIKNVNKINITSRGGKQKYLTNSYSDSDSSDNNSDDSSHHVENVNKKHINGKVKYQKSVSKEKRSHLRQKRRQLQDKDESDTEPEVIKKKKTEERLTGHDEDDEEYTAIKEELSHMSFEELQKLRDRLGIKVYNKVTRKGQDKQPMSSSKQKFSRENKNRPVEMSSKRPVSVYREIMPAKKKVIRDPRFDDLSGNFNEAIFRSSYAFVDDIKKKEKEKLSKQLKKAKNAKKKEELKFLINRMNQQESADRMKKRRKEMEKDWKKKELSRVEEGKNPYFLKKADLRKLELAERFKELKKTGKLDKYLGKKRKKNASKEKKKLPDS